MSGPTIPGSSRRWPRGTASSASRTPRIRPRRATDLVDPEVRGDVAPGRYGILPAVEPDGERGNETGEGAVRIPGRTSEHDGIPKPAGPLPGLAIGRDDDQRRVRPRGGLSGRRSEPLMVRRQDHHTDVRQVPQGEL